MQKLEFPIVIVANGAFPTHKEPINILNNSNTIIACDGAADKLLKNNYVPNVIIGDLDSISLNIKKIHQDKIIKVEDQSNNDLQKAIDFVIANKVNSINIIGATGLREDHQIGNIFSILDYDDNINIKIYTDYGIFKRVFKNSKFSSYVGQKISLFNIDNTIKIKSNGLKYNINKSYISTIYSMTLNESISKNINFNLSHGKLLIFQKY